MLGSLLPFLTYLGVERASDARAALLVAALIAVALFAFNVVIRRREWKLLELGSLVVFCGLALVVLAAGIAIPLPAVRLSIDLGLLGVVLVSIAIGRPFTLQYVAGPMSEAPHVRRAHRVASWAWAAAFASTALINSVWLLHPSLRPMLMFAATGSCLYAAYRFTRWYPRRPGPGAATAATF